MIRSSLVTAVAAIALFAAPASPQAAPDTFRLGQITVTATKLPAPLAAVPAHVTVITGEALRASGVRRVVDALRDQAGVAVAQLGSPGAVASVFMRGGESDYVQVLVDGVQINDPGGAFDWAHLTTADVERIEIVRGPASVLYGSDAVSGVVQIFTSRGRGRPRVQAELSGGQGERVGAGASGTYDTWDGSASVTGGTRVAPSLDASYSFSAARQQSAGAYAFNNDYDNTTVAGRVGLTARGGTAAAFTTRYTEQLFHYPTDGAGNVLDHNRYTFGDALAAGINVTRPFGPRLNAQLSLGAYRNDTGGEDPEDEAGVGFSRSSAAVERDNLELRVDARAARQLTISVGGELERQQGVSTFESDGPFGPFSSRTADERSNRAAFAQLVHAGERLGVTAGARVDRSDQFGTFTTARAGLTYQLAQSLRAHAALGTGFKEPTFLETYATGFARGNPALEPEQSRSGELGVRAAVGGAHIAVTGFYQQFRNLIQYTFAPPTEDSPNYFNIGRATAGGVEFEVGAALLPTLTASAAYTGLRTKVTDAGFGQDMQFVEGESLLRRPAHHLTGGLSWQPGRVQVLLQGDYTGERADLDFTDPAVWQGKRVDLDAHATVSTSLRYRPALSWGDAELTVRVRNLLGADYEEVFNFPAPGRVITIGASLAR